MADQPKSTPAPRIPSPDPHPGPSGIDRRAFLKTTAAGASMLMIPGMPVFAGPFDENDYLKYIPADKKLDPAWVRSLFERGAKETYTDPVALEQIGMPVGGLFAGTVYLAGDGRLWLWDIFNRDQEGILPKSVEFGGREVRTRDGANYVEPARVWSPFRQGFELIIGDRVWPLDKSGFETVEFDGRYPMGIIRYRDPGCPVEVTLEAFSPFIPGNAAESSLPATIMRFTVRNLSDKEVACGIRGFTENPVCIDSAKEQPGYRQNRVVGANNLTALLCEALPAREGKASKRKDILFEDFESEDFGTWTVTGDAFGSGPIRRSDVPDYQGDLGGQGERLVNSHASAPGSSVGGKDGAVGTLTSREFTIERKFIVFYIGGGAHKGRTCLDLLIDGQVVASVTGKERNAMELAGIPTGQWEGRKAVIRIVDEVSGGWGNIGVDHIVFTDAPPKSQPLGELRDFGTFCLALLGSPKHRATADIGKRSARKARTRKLSDPLSGNILGEARLPAGGESEMAFAFTWHFSNFYGRDFGGVKVGHSYVARFGSALEVAAYISENKDFLIDTTRTWVDTWYDSTLPFWLLDRTMANTSTLATTTCYRHYDGRFWAWEGIGCCTGTCTHVWHYAQAVGRLFPEIERDQRERVDFGMALKENGEIGYRALLTTSMGPAFDGQCGRILGAYREHLMSADDAFLRRNWPAIKRAIQYMIERDGDHDGILEGSQPNTLDADWYGKISFISSLYIAALRAGEAMAMERGDQAFSRTCSAIAEQGAKNIRELFNGEYFIQLEDPDHKDVIGVGAGCYIDQVFGQTWAHWVSLGHLFDRGPQLAALRSLYRYNFVPDIGPFRRHFTAGRWYAMAGDGGLLMCTWPKGGKRDKWEDQWQFMYFNECMSGFEWQAAAHMIYEGIDQPDLLQNGLAVSRAIHDRYNGRLRNPYNEIECSDHYARAMASYGVFLAVTGFFCHGPQGIIGFDPRLTPNDFKCAFVGPEGWGTWSQKSDKQFEARLEVKYGRLSLQEINLRIPAQWARRKPEVTVNGVPVAHKIEGDHNGMMAVRFERTEVREVGIRY